MAQGYDFDYSVTDEQKAHFDRLRQDRGWSWDLLADNLERHAVTDPATAGLVAWARQQSKGDKSARAAKSGKENR